MNPTSSDGTPSDPTADASVPAAGSPGGEQTFDWSVLVVLVHPQKVEIIEALRYVGEPLSATDLSKIFAPAKAGQLSNVSYHVRSLAEAGVIKKVSERKVRGVQEKFFSLS